MLSSLGMSFSFTATTTCYKPTFNSSSVPKLSATRNFNHASTAFRNPKPAIAAAAVTIAAETTPEKLGVVVKPMEKPRLVLKFTWMDKNIGLALDQVISGFGTIPVSPYYFWPRKDAWEELKIMLESKP